MARPWVLTWIFGLSSLAWIAARVNGFHDAGVWIVVSVVLALMARAAEREQLKAQIAAPAAPPSVSSPLTPPPVAPPAGWYQDPDGVGGRRWWDGARWTEHRDAAPEKHG